MKVCSKSVIDEETFPGVGFDKDGVSEYFRYLKDLIDTKRMGDSMRVLDDFLNRMLKRSKQGKYNAVLGISGGVDSCYLAYLCREWNLRVLLVHMDNHWNTSLAEHNMNQISRITGFPLERWVLDKDSFFDLQISFFKSSTSDLENPTDIAILGALSRTARKYKIKNILLATNYETEGFVPRGWHYNCRDDVYMRNVHWMFGKKNLRSFPFYNWKDEMKDKMYYDIRFLYPLNVVPYDKQEAKKSLTALAGWKDYKVNHHESSYTAFVQKYVLLEKFGIDYRKIFYTAMICGGKISREEAIRNLMGKPYNADTIENEKREIAERWGMKYEEFQRWFKMPRKTYRDYGNDEKFLRVLYRLYYCWMKKEEPYRYYEP